MLGEAPFWIAGASLCLTAAVLVASLFVLPSAPARRASSLVGWVVLDLVATWAGVAFWAVWRSAP